MVKHPYRLLADHLKGNLRYQPLFERLYKSLVLAMNYGAGGDIQSSGELVALQVLREKLQGASQGPIVLFDVGANTGDYARSLLQVFGDQPIRILAFEPSPASYALLIHSLQEEADRVELYPFGFSDCPAELTLFSEPKAGSTIASLYPSSLAQHWGLGTLQEEKIILQTLDDFCTTQKIDFIHFLKIDVEGHELNVLQGAKNLIEQNRIRFIQFEFGHCNIDSRTFFRDFYRLLNDRYRIYRVMKNGLFLIEQYQEMYEIFSVVNYFAEHR
ncbi:hypothetical protein BST81_08590 [Leptolyngbya sp. 'hensonii']|uniref:FkbM family methyltransferase n=1 Tax=Leptolyngbya sp. 'hensonii' TaxID=1922337 RepID=UPI00094FBE64|nr:FkbM family methyltransferase [Leptolyngbya sp. 'hensonii']OLP18787.1 hypothetical protein BST81_08590 [Leptolyngbya sp. 'hensonii']